jgi:hypothetical protein
MQDGDDNDTATTANANANNATLFAWGADQILQRQPKLLVLGVTKEDVVQAIRRVALNSFTVQGLLDNADMEALALVVLSSSNTDTDTDTDTTDTSRRQSAVMDIGRQHPRGIGLYLLASAANHSCAPNAHYTFDSQTNAITVRAIHSISAHEVVTISYGPVGGAPVPERRAELYESHFFWCHCPACVSETTTSTTTDNGDVDNGDVDNGDEQAMDFIEEVLMSGTCTASEALQKAMDAPPTIRQSRLFRKAMSDTAIQSIDTGGDDNNQMDLAVGFQKLALQSLELSKCPNGHIDIAYDLLRLGVLRHTMHMMSGHHHEQEHAEWMERARDILRTYYGEEYPFRNTMDAISNGTSLLHTNHRRAGRNGGSE